MVKKNFWKIFWKYGNGFISLFIMEKKNKVYPKYDDKYWDDVIIPEYMKKGVNYPKIREMFNVSHTDVNKRLKGLKDKQPKVGDTNNLLTIIDINIPPVLSGIQLRRVVMVRCECGKEFDAKLYEFKVGKVKSCGCLVKNSHGHSYYSKGNTEEGRRTYGSYLSMRQRCYYVEGEGYPHYGGRGIKVCDRWLEEHNGYKNFLEDMGFRPKGMTLDRIDVDGNYEPGNCRWSNYKIQRINQRRVLDIKKYTDDEWLEIMKDYNENKLSYDDISEKYSVPLTTIIRSFGRIRKKDDIKLWENINEFYKNNKVPYKVLSEMFGVSPGQCVRRLIKN
jgi:DNA-binding Lrp family transcriptional regulator